MTLSLQSFSPLATLAVLWLAQVATPGPNFVRISHAALAVSRRAALSTATGTAIGNSIWCAVAVGGATALASEGWLGQAIRILGTGYLAWIGAKLLLQSLGPRSASTRPAAQEVRVRSGRAAVQAGLVTSLTNPQAALFFATYFVAAMPRTAAPWLFAAAVAVVGLVTILWYVFVVGVLAAPKAREFYLRLRPMIDAVFGLLILTMAWRLLSSI